MTGVREQAREAGQLAGPRHRHIHAANYPCDCHIDAADAASDVWESRTATAQLREAGIDLERLDAVLASSDNWGNLVYAYEVLTVLGAVRNEMEALG